jgi:hypothetical protein
MVQVVECLHKQAQCVQTQVLPHPFLYKEITKAMNDIKEDINK